MVVEEQDHWPLSAVHWHQSPEIQACCVLGPQVSAAPCQLLLPSHDGGSRLCLHVAASAALRLDHATYQSARPVVQNAVRKRCYMGPKANCDHVSAAGEAQHFHALTTATGHCSCSCYDRLCILCRAYETHAFRFVPRKDCSTQDRLSLIPCNPLVTACRFRIPVLVHRHMRKMRPCMDMVWCHARLVE